MARSLVPAVRRRVLAWRPVVHFGLPGYRDRAVCERKGHSYPAGVAFSILLYKPTLLVLIFPMLVVGSRWRVLTGLAAGAVVLVSLSAMVAGTARVFRVRPPDGDLCPARWSGVDWVSVAQVCRPHSVPPTPWSPTRVARPLAIALSVPPLMGLVAVSRPCPRGSRDEMDLAWTATLCWSPVLGVYSPIYDAILIVPGLVLGADAIRRRNPTGWSPAFRVRIALLYAAAGALAVAFRKSSVPTGDPRPGRNGNVPGLAGPQEWRDRCKAESSPV